jgi:hypothetical protein
MRQLRSQQDKGGFALAIHQAERLVGSSVSGGGRAWFRTVIVGLGLVGILVYFIVLANAGLFEEFNPDDTTNMYRAWTASASHLIRTATLDFWKGELRPVGFLFYKCIHYLFGFWSFPFRAACFVFIIANLILQFILYTRVFQKIEFAMLALLAGCFHGALWSIYASTGTIFDVLCLFFCSSL